MKFLYEYDFAYYQEFHPFVFNFCNARTFVLSRVALDIFKSSSRGKLLELSSMAELHKDLKEELDRLDKLKSTENLKAEIFKQGNSFELNVTAIYLLADLYIEQGKFLEGIFALAEYFKKITYDENQHSFACHIFQAIRRLGRYLVPDYQTGHFILRVISDEKLLVRVRQQGLLFLSDFIDNSFTKKEIDIVFNNGEFFDYNKRFLEYIAYILKLQKIKLDCKVELMCFTYLNSANFGSYKDPLYYFYFSKDWFAFFKDTFDILRENDLGMTDSLLFMDMIRFHFINLYKNLKSSEDVLSKLDNIVNKLSYYYSLIDEKVTGIEEISFNQRYVLCTMYFYLLEIEQKILKTLDNKELYLGAEKYLGEIDRIKKFFSRIIHHGDIALFTTILEEINKRERATILEEINKRERVNSSELSKLEKTYKRRAEPDFAEEEDAVPGVETKRSRHLLAGLWPMTSLTANNQEQYGNRKDVITDTNIDDLFDTFFLIKETDKRELVVIKRNVKILFNGFSSVKGIDITEDHLKRKYSHTYGIDKIKINKHDNIRIRISRIMYTFLKDQGLSGAKFLKFLLREEIWEILHGNEEPIMDDKGCINEARLNSEFASKLFAASAFSSEELKDFGRILGEWLKALEQDTKTSLSIDQINKLDVLKEFFNTMADFKKKSTIDEAFNLLIYNEKKVFDEYSKLEGFDKARKELRLAYAA